ncbi:NHL repeat protein [Pseudobythopirellula maris]|uniref:NHL repeat protein n=2 Tax=Pseudobythopirellula maris TaxID=2527991 RepID=A0A5C5ZPF6_9BACT|nr:NHL repeat protein [Pseudobythopirellula maris]
MLALPVVLAIGSLRWCVAAPEPVAGSNAPPAATGEPEWVYADAGSGIAAGEGHRKLAIDWHDKRVGAPFRGPVRNTPHPFEWRTSPATQLPDPSRWLRESIAGPTVNWFDNIPILRRRDGKVVIEQLFSKSGKTELLAFRDVERYPSYEGPRNDSLVSPYATYRCFPKSTSIRGWQAIDLAGRLWHVLPDGSTHAIAGRWTDRGQIPDETGGPWDEVGEFIDGPFSRPVDLAFAPHDNRLIYVADTGNRRLCAVSGSREEGTTVLEAEKLSFEPNSLDMVEGRTVVADLEGDRVWVGEPGALEPFEHPLIRRPQCVRFDSRGDVVIACQKSKHILRLDPDTGVVARLHTATAEGQESWVWLDVDTEATCFGRDAILVVSSVGSAKRRMELVLADGEVIRWTIGPSDYQWAVCIDDVESRVVMSGFGDTSGVIQIRPRGASDPPASHRSVIRRRGKGHAEWRQLPACLTYGSSGMGFVTGETIWDLARLTDRQIRERVGPVSDDVIFWIRGAGR